MDVRAQTDNWPFVDRPLHTGDLAEVYFSNVTAHLTERDVYLLFDRYYDHSVKAVTRAERIKNVLLKHLLSLKTRLLERGIALG